MPDPIRPIRVDRRIFDNRVDIDPFPPKTIICLSGGGIKGAFEVGALYYLSKKWSKLNIIGATGTSTGAINALVVATKEQSAAAMLADFYLSAKNIRALFSETPEFSSFKNKLIPLGIKIDPATFDFDLPDMKELEKEMKIQIGIFAGGLFLSPTPIEPLLLAFILFKDEAQKIRSLSSAIKDLSELQGIFNHDPAFNIITTKIGNNLTNGTKLLLRMYMVQYEDGQLYYMDGQGHVYDSATGNETRYALGNEKKSELLMGAKASSAIPFFIPPQRFPQTQTRKVDYFMDGGVRENMPLKGAREMGAERIISILCSTPELKPENGHPNAFSMLARTLSIFQSETLEDEISPPYGFNDDVQRVIIHSDVVVIDDRNAFNFDPGLIRILMDDGYMTAWEAVNLVRFSESQQNEISQTRRDITSLRKKIWELEKNLNTNIPPTPVSPYPHYIPQPLWSSNARLVNDIRSHKFELLELVKSRINATENNFDCVPEIKINGRIKSSYQYWYKFWERHSKEIPTSPWGSQPFCGDLIAAVNAPVWP